MKLKQELLTQPAGQMWEKIRVELNENINTRDQDLSAIKDWLKKQPHLPDEWGKDIVVMLISWTHIQSKDVLVEATVLHAGPMQVLDTCSNERINFLRRAVFIMISFTVQASNNKLNSVFQAPNLLRMSHSYSRLDYLHRSVL